MVNFRKVLALVLVIATLFSFAAMAGAKFIDLKEDEIPEAETSYYDDEADIDAAYVEGVRVLSYVKILNGYEDGTFKAQNNIRRNEMAKMIAVLANAGYDVEDLYATAANF
ncbi:MAG: S-layer homology domain-containing protein, partial [Oscillospiraceae bacterium]|nr:S-layer homology domain-containing protein [Oscillospiraceae bacterium]